MKFSLSKSALSIGLLSLLSACQPISDSSLLTDQKDQSSLSLNKDPKSEELYLKSFSPSIHATGLNKVDIAGECYVSTYPKHSIVVMNGGNLLDIVDINPRTASNTAMASCKNGRFNLTLNTGVLGNGVFSLKIVLQAWDENNQVFVNQVQGTNSVTLTR